MLTNWHNTDHYLKNRRQELLAEVQQYRLARLSQSAQPRQNSGALHRLLTRLKLTGTAPAHLKQQPAA